MLPAASPVITQTSTDDLIELRVSTVGQRLPGVEARIVNPETNAEVPPGTQGEVVCRGYNVMKGYYRKFKLRELGVAWLKERGIEPV